MQIRTFRFIAAAVGSCDPPFINEQANKKPPQGNCLQGLWELGN